jgi:uncharacterized protein YegL
VLDRDAIPFAENPDPRVACLLLLDSSGSMQGSKIDGLNMGLKAFRDDIVSDHLASRRTEIAIVTFGDTVQELGDFVVAADFDPPTLQASGLTPLGEALDLALAKIAARKAVYDRNGVPSYRPWVFLISDGAPTDEWEEAAERAKEQQEAGRLALFAVGVGDDADYDVLRQISTRDPVKLHGLRFVEMFLWLSRSQQRVSASKPGDQVPLEAPTGWGTV